MVWPAVIAAVAALGSAYLSKKGQDDANDANQEIARQQMDFQERMANTAYQRAMADASKAGFNPMLGYTQGGAATPPGAGTRVENEYAPAVASAQAALGLMQGYQQVMQSEAQTEKLRAETARTYAQTFEKSDYLRRFETEVERTRAGASLAGQQQVTEAQKPRLMATQEEVNKVVRNLREVELDRANTTFADDVRIRKLTAQLMGMEVPRAEAEKKFYESDFGVNNPYIKQLLDVIRGVSGAASAGRPWR